ncbi:MAG: hypothetical protein ACOCVR_02150, partial [Myxococcota bacterium]
MRPLHCSLCPPMARRGPGPRRPLLLVLLVLQAALSACSRSDSEPPELGEAQRFPVDPELLGDRLPGIDPATLGVDRGNELTELRDASSYTFRREDGASVAIAFAGPVN